jgi:hypothetical protein
METSAMGASALTTPTTTAEDAQAAAEAEATAWPASRTEVGNSGPLLKGPHDFRHTLATWLEDAAVPSRVIDQLMGHGATRTVEDRGSPMGAIYRHTTAEMWARVTTVLDDRLAIALSLVDQAWTNGRYRGTDEEPSGADVGVELRGFEPLTSCMPSVLPGH